LGAARDTRHERSHRRHAQGKHSRHPAPFRGHAGKSPSPSPGSGERKRGARMTSRYQRERSVAIAYLALLGTLAIASPAFYSGDKVRTLLVGSAPVLVAAVGMTIIILARHIDISIGSQFSICGIAAGLLAQIGLPMPLVLLGTVGLGAGLG